MKFRTPQCCRKCWNWYAEPHGDRLQCVECHDDRGPLDSAVIKFVNEIERVFGPIVDPIITRETELQPSASAEELAAPDTLVKEERR